MDAPPAHPAAQSFWIYHVRERNALSLTALGCRERETMNRFFKKFPFRSIESTILTFHKYKPYNGEVQNFSPNTLQFLLSAEKKCTFPHHLRVLPAENPEQLWKMFSAVSISCHLRAILKTVTNCRGRLNFRLLQMGNLKKFWKKFPIRSINAQKLPFLSCLAAEVFKVRGV